MNKCKNCEEEFNTPPVIDFYNVEHCSDTCAERYKKFRDSEYDDYVDPTGFYRNKAMDPNE